MCYEAVKLTITGTTTPVSLFVTSLICGPGSKADDDVKDSLLASPLRMPPSGCHINGEFISRGVFQ